MRKDQRLEFTKDFNSVIVGYCLKSGGYSIAEFCSSDIKADVKNAKLFIKAFHAQEPRK